MTRRTVIATLTVLALVAAGMMSSPATAGPGGRYIVVLKDSTPSAAAVARDHSQRYGARVSHVYEHALKGYAAELSGRAVQGISRDRRVDFVEADQVVEAFEVPTGVDRVEADKKLGFGGETATSTIATPVDVDIAILDTGISAHADLTIEGGWNCAKGGPFNNSCDEGGYDDGNGHGTHVAGSAAAKNALFGVATGARLWAVKVLGNDGSGWISWIVAGINKVTENADTIEVANMSLGCKCSSDSLDKALTNSTNAGVVYAAAAGNSKEDAKDFSPANHPQVIGVSAMSDGDGKAGGALAPSCRSGEKDDWFASFSNFGDVVDLAAPGVCIKSTWNDGGYRTISGTSMASPHGAGAAALYIVENGTAKSSTRWSTVRDGLRGSGWSVSQSHTCGFGGGKSSEPMLMLADCDVAGSDGGTGNQAPTASFTYDCTDLSCDFDGSGSSDSDGSIDSYEWDFGDGSTGSGVTVSHTYGAGGTYTVTLTVTDNDGATDSTSQSVTVSDSSGSDPAALSVSVDQGNSWRTGPWYRTNLHVGVTSDGTQVSGASVTLRIYSGTSCSGSAVASSSGTTGSDGTVTFEFRTRNSGDYCALATAEKSGYTEGSGSLVFTMQ